MKLILIFPPFHPPSAPPLGIAYLKAAASQKIDNINIKLRDWNAKFFSRWLGGREKIFCQYCPNQGLACICPELLVEGHAGQRLAEGLRIIPSSREEEEEYINAAIKFQGLYNSLRYCYNALLRSYIEGRRSLPNILLEGLFQEELAFIKAEKPDIVGFSVLGEQNLLPALALGKFLYQELALPIALGGAMLSHLSAEELLGAFDWIDYIFVGEAEEVLPLWLTHWPDKIRHEIPGVFCRTSHNTHLHPASPIPSLDSLPFPDFSDFALEDYLIGLPVFPIISSRGCYWRKCAFCTHHRPYPSGIRYRSIEKVVDEIEYHRDRFGIQHFLFTDEVIAPARLKSLAEEVLARDIKIIFGAEGIRPERGFTLSLFKLAYKAGLRWIYLGVESITPRLLNLIQKGIQLKDIYQIITHCDQANIIAHLSYIIGLPSQTQEELINEIGFLKSRPVDWAPFVLLLGSIFHKESARYGINIEDQEIMFSTREGVVHVPKFHFTINTGLTPRQALRIVKDAGILPRVKPHLGEMHAVLLSNTDFFHSVAKPNSIAKPELYAEKILLAKDQKSPWDIIHLAGCYELQGKTEEALNLLLGKITRKEFDNITDQLLLHIAACFNQLGKYDQAIESIQKATFSPEVAPALWGELARAYFSQHQYLEAAAAAEKMLALGIEGSGGIYFALGLCYEALGRYREAIMALNRAQEMDLVEAEINLALSRCYQSLGDQKGAERELAKARRKYLSY
jgi:hypothetical protein